jgi:hypothetical protein
MESVSKYLSTLVCPGAPASADGQTAFSLIAVSIPFIYRAIPHNKWWWTIPVASRLQGRDNLQWHHDLAQADLLFVLQGRHLLPVLLSLTVGNLHSVIMLYSWLLAFLAMAIPRTYRQLLAAPTLTYSMFVVLRLLDPFCALLDVWARQDMAAYHPLAAMAPKPWALFGCECIVSILLQVLYAVLVD